jgi:hypothetical protein
MTETLGLASVAASPAHTAPVPSLALTLVLVVAGLGASVVIALSLVALLRRRSPPYLLVTLAIGTILARTGVAVVSMQGALDVQTHHLAEHALDVVMVGLVIAAVYTARRPASRLD